MPGDNRGQIGQRRWLFGMAAVLLGLIIAMPYALKGNQQAQIFFTIALTIVTTLVSIFATKWYSRSQAQAELTRYGLQAWRNLDSLAIKIAQQLGVSALERARLEEWLLDVDQGKWAWRDLLREAFELQERLQLETEEIATRYKAKIAKAESPESKSQLLSEEKREVARLLARAPLPMRLPVDVSCPNCTSSHSVMLGTSAGDTAWTICPTCRFRFSVHRLPDGGVKRGGAEPKREVTEECPACAGTISLHVPFGRAVEFVTECQTCRTHLRFRGTSQEHEITDLGKVNANFSCPYCREKADLWITPDREVVFLTSCSLCGRQVQVSGAFDSFEVTKAGEQ